MLFCFRLCIIYISASQPVAFLIYIYPPFVFFWGEEEIARSLFANDRSPIFAKTSRIVITFYLSNDRMLPDIVCAMDFYTLSFSRYYLP